MTHAALTPLLGREFDVFLSASIDDDRNAPWLSVVSALAQLDVDPWKEAADLARMPRERAVERLTALIAALPQHLAASSPSEVAAVRLIALLPASAALSVPAPTVLLKAASGPRSLMMIGLGVLVVALVVYFAFAANVRSPSIEAPAFDSAQPAPSAHEPPATDGDGSATRLNPAER